MRVITFSRFFPVKHPRAGEQTYFREKIWAGLADTMKGFKIPDEITDWDWHEYYNGWPKVHTIRAGNRWKVGEQFSPRVWSGKPYASKQIQFAPPITITKIWDIEISPIGGNMTIGYHFDNSGYLRLIPLCDVAQNDGLECRDFQAWFNVHSKRKEQSFTGQIICWNKNINY